MLDEIYPIRELIKTEKQAEGEFQLYSQRLFKEEKKH